MASYVSKVIPTSPLFGTNLADLDVFLNTRSAPVVEPKPDELDIVGTLKSERESEEMVAEWRDVSANKLPAPLNPSNESAGKQRAELATEGATLIRQIQEIAKGHGKPDRGFQRKTLYVTGTARMRVPPNLPEPLRVGPFQPGGSYRALVRFSSAGSK
jgi:hypothetical protein